MKIKSLILLLFVSIGYAASAQDAIVTMSLGEYEKAKARIASLSSEIESFKAQVDTLNIKLNEKDCKIGQLEQELINKNNLFQSKNSEIAGLKDTLSLKENEITGLKKEVAALDTVRLRYANGRLQLPFNQEKVNQAIELFNGISDLNLRNECSEVLTWLSNYSSYLCDVHELIQSIQSDNHREDKVYFYKWKSSSLHKINRNRYVRDSRGHQFSILYLDEIISIAKKRLTKATKPTVDLSDLVERLELQ